MRRKKLPRQVVLRALDLLHTDDVGILLAEPIEKTLLGGRPNTVQISGDDTKHEASLYIGELLDLDPFQRLFRRGIFELQTLQRAHHQLRNHNVAVRLRIGGNHEPWRNLRLCRAQSVLISLAIIVPEFAGFEIRWVELPVLLRVIDTRLQSRSLLVLRYMQKALHDRRTVIREQRFEFANLPVTTFAFFLIDLFQHARYEHVFVLAAIENGELARGRHLRMDAPEKIVRGFAFGRRLERHDAQTE